MGGAGGEALEVGEPSRASGRRTLTKSFLGCVPLFLHLLNGDTTSHSGLNETIHGKGLAL